jgi:uncharacterized protein
VQKNLENLLEVQGLDKRLHEVRVRLAEFPPRLRTLDARLAAAKAEIDRTKAAQHATLKDRKKYELDVEQWKERVAKYKDQMFQVKTNEAYKALQHEVQMAEDGIRKAEDRLLEQMVSSEEYDARVKASEKALKDVEETVRRERLEIENAKASAEKDLHEGNAGRARLVMEIPEDLLDHYERIAKKHDGIALAEVLGEKCTACGMRVRPHVFQEMRRPESKEMFHCETCTRILYYIERTASAAASPAASPAAPSSPLPNEC